MVKKHKESDKTAQNFVQWRCVPWAGKAAKAEASDKLSAGFSFHVKAEEKVRVDWADGVNQMQLAFRYQSDFEFTEYVDY